MVILMASALSEVLYRKMLVNALLVVVGAISWIVDGTDGLNAATDAVSRAPCRDSKRRNRAALGIPAMNFILTWTITTSVGR